MTRKPALNILMALTLLPGLACAATPACDTSIHDGEQPRTVAMQALACQLQSHRLLLLGELHGTVESPALLADLLRDQPSKRPIRLGLEWPVELQSKVDAYFRSQGTAADRAAFAAGRDWTYYDGRMSRAWLTLIDALRDLHRQGRDVQVFTMEPAYGTPADVAAAGGPVRVKEAGMAKAIREQLKHAPPDALVAALMGNYHSRVGAQMPDLESSLAYRLAGDHPLEVLPQSGHGTFWAILSGEGRAAVQTIHGSEPPLPKGDVTVRTVPDAPAGVEVEKITLPVFTASPHP